MLAQVPARPGDALGDSLDRPAGRERDADADLLRVVLPATRRAN